MAHILIIDDDDDIRLLVGMLLESAGHTVAKAGRGAEGLAYLAAHHADGVLLDINMPDMIGWEVCRRIKSDPATAQTPVVILTVHSALRETAERERAKADGFVNKPFTKSELLSTLDSAMGAVALSMVQ